MDRLVNVIVDAIRKEKSVTAADRWRAVIRAGKIAEAYCLDSGDLVDSVFGDLLKDNSE